MGVDLAKVDHCYYCLGVWNSHTFSLETSSDCSPSAQL